MPFLTCLRYGVNLVPLNWGVLYILAAPFANLCTTNLSDDRFSIGVTGLVIVAVSSPLPDTSVYAVYPTIQYSPNWLTDKLFIIGPIFYNKILPAVLAKPINVEKNPLTLDAGISADMHNVAGDATSVSPFIRKAFCLHYVSELILLCHFFPTLSIWLLCASAI